ncbi:MAG TPA: tetratricopeptide repeat protein [Acidisarcina sp.]
MRILSAVLFSLARLPIAAQTVLPPSPHPAADLLSERLGTESFQVSCAPSTQPYFNRGVALLHDFWYQEARTQFDQLIKSDPSCAMAHWGVAMSAFHQIWGRPDDAAVKLGWTEMQAAQALPVHTERERAYIAALAGFYRPGNADFPARIGAYSAALAKLHAQSRADVDTGAFYALSLLSAEAPADTTLAQEHKAMAILAPLFANHPDHPGVVHYIIHACDNPAMAAEGLAAADRYGEIAPSGPHAFHMPGHIYARLGLWPQDIASQVGSIKASQAADARGESGIMDELHSYDFLIYAYLQSGQDKSAKAALDDSAAPLNMIAAMPGMGAGHRDGMVPYYRSKLPAFYALEMRDWKTAAAMQPVVGAPPQVATMVYWVKALADGRLRSAEHAQADLVRYDELVAEVRKGKNAYMEEGTEVERNEILAWVAFAEGRQDDALKTMRSAADRQDKVGQAEVDIPAREMLADMLLEFSQPKQALAEYQIALRLSPNRLNALYNAGRAAEAAGDKAAAKSYYSTLLKITNNGQNSGRPELAYATRFVSSMQSSGN